MSYEPSGESGTGVTTKTELNNFSSLDDRSGGHLPGYTSLSSPEDVPTAVRPGTTGVTRGRDRTAKIAQRDAVRRGLTNAKDAAESMAAYAGAGELIDLSVAGSRLMEVLDDLWNVRGVRENDWGDLLNILQGALSNEEFEQFTSDQCDAILTIIADHLASGVVGMDDIEDSLRLLRKAGLDPWKAISGDLPSGDLL